MKYIIVLLTLLSSTAIAEEAKPSCGKTIEECQKLVDNQAKIINILKIKASDYLTELFQAHDALETNLATQKADQTGGK